MMRLTLRTLLAYLDDMLEPADTKIIGQKIQESPMAQLLVSRIREVMRRRRLKAPDVFGPEMGIDPNIVSQYLDNTLSAERYADVERVLLASDEMLAEAASCHEVLTVDPPAVEMSMRERLYALGPVDSDSQLVVPEETPRAGMNRTPQSIPIRNGLNQAANGHSNSSPDDHDKTTTVPDYLKRSPWSRRALPSAIVALLIIISAVLIAPEILTRIRQAKNEIKLKGDREKNGEVTISEQKEMSNNPNHDPVLIASDRTFPSSSATATDIPAPKLRQGLDPVPPTEYDEDMVVPAPGTGITPQNKTGAGRVDATDVVPSPNALSLLEPSPESPVMPKPFPIPPEASKDVSINYSSNDGVLIRFDSMRHHWLMVPHRSAMQPGDLIASIEPFDSIVDFDKGGVRTTLVGEVVARLLDPAIVGLTGWDIQQGRIVVQSGRQADDISAKIGIVIGEDIWQLELIASDTVCGLEVTPRQPSQFQKLPEGCSYQAMLYVLRGSAKWTNRQGKTVELGEQVAVNIVPAENAHSQSNPVSISTTPDWCDSVKRKAMPAKKHQSQIQFEKAFELEQPVDEGMLNLVRNSKSPRIAELATQCLAAIGDVAGLVEAIAECPHEEARFAARDGIRMWLTGAPDRGLKLKEELDMHYPPAEADAIYQMLWGFSRDDVINSKPHSWRFIDWMRSPKTEIRELADYWVEHLTEKKTEYRAQGGTAAQRESHVRRIEEQIERNNGLIKGP